MHWTDIRVRLNIILLSMQPRFS